MFKKSVVTLALFAGLLTASSALAQDFVITSAKAASEPGIAGLSSSPAPQRVEILVHKSNTQIAGQVWVMVKYFGTDVLGSLRNGPGLVSKVAGTACQTGAGEYKISLDLPWREFAARAGLKGQFVYFNAKVILPTQSSRPVTFNAVAP